MNWDTIQQLSDLDKRVAFLHRQGKYDEAIENAERALNLASGAFGPDHRYTETARKNLLLLRRAKVGQKSIAGQTPLEINTGGKSIWKIPALLKILPLIFCLSMISTVSLITGMVHKADTAPALSPEPAAEIPGKMNKLPYYIIEADFYPRDRIVIGKERVFFEHFNPEKEVVFDLYLNAYSSGNRKPSQMQRYARERGWEPGYINIQKVCYRGKEITHEEEGNLLKVNLDKPLFTPGEQSLEIYFEAKMPMGADRVGGNEKGIWLGNWLPTLSVDGEQKVITDIGDPFVNFSSTYEVTLSLPGDYNLVLSNTSLAEEGNDNRKIYRGRLENVRDLPVFLNRDYNKKTIKSGNTTINYYYYRDNEPEKVLTAAAEALSFFSKTVGEYPWEQLNIVENDMYLSGMEYSTLILLSNKAVKHNVKKTVFHETGHQWFYNIIGSDQYNAPFMDEGLVEFMVLNAVNNIKPQLHYDPAELSKPLDEFDSWEQYRAVHYRQGQKWYAGLYSSMGQERFNRFIRDYYQEFKYQLVTPGEFKTFLLDYLDPRAASELTGPLETQN